jgi:hypothetical protein
MIPCLPCDKAQQERHNVSFLLNTIKNGYDNMPAVKSLLESNRETITKILVKEIGKTLTVIGVPTLGIDISKGFAYSQGMKWDMYEGDPNVDYTKNKDAQWLKLTPTTLSKHDSADTTKTKQLIEEHITSRYAYIPGEFQCIQFANEFVLKARAMGYDNVYLAGGWSKQYGFGHAFVAIVSNKNMELADLSRPMLTMTAKRNVFLSTLDETGTTKTALFDQDDIILLEPQSDKPIEQADIIGKPPSIADWDGVVIFKNYVLSKESVNYVLPVKSSDAIIIQRQGIEPPTGLMKMGGKTINDIQPENAAEAPMGEKVSYENWPTKIQEEMQAIPRRERPETTEMQATTQIIKETKSRMLQLPLATLPGGVV